MRGYARYFNIISIILVIFLILAILWKFITPIITSFIVAYLLYPLYKRINTYVKNDNLSAMLICIILIVIIILPFAALISKAAEETQAVYQLATRTLNETEGIDYCDTSKTAACLIAKGFEELGTNEEVNRVLENSFKNLSGFLVQRGSDVIFAIPSAVIGIFIMLFMTFYLVRDGKSILLEHIPSFLPLKKKEKTKIVASFDTMVRGLLFGQLIIALVQGFVAGIGYFMFGVGSPVFWGLFTAFFALIPVIGTGIIWFPAAAIMLLNGYLSSDNTLMFQGIGLMAYGFLFISTIDNVIRPKIMGDQAHIHPVIVLLGVFGGISLFGFIGFIIGPVLLATCYMLLKIYAHKV